MLAGITNDTPRDALHVDTGVLDITTAFRMDKGWLELESDPGKMLLSYTIKTW